MNISQLTEQHDERGHFIMQYTLQRLFSEAKIENFHWKNFDLKSALKTYIVGTC